MELVEIWTIDVGEVMAGSAISVRMCQYICWQATVHWPSAGVILRYASLMIFRCGSSAEGCGSRLVEVVRLLANPSQIRQSLNPPPTRNDATTRPCRMCADVWADNRRFGSPGKETSSRKKTPRHEGRYQLPSRNFPIGTGRRLRGLQSLSGHDRCCYTKKWYDLSGDRSSQRVYIISGL